MKVIATHYQGDWSWIPEFTNDFFIYNRSEEEIPNSVSRENFGDADYDRLSYIIDNYQDLPEVFMLTKSNIFKFITPEEFDKVKNNQAFTPLLTKNHKEYADSRGVVCYYQDDIYHERNDNWFLNEVPALHFDSWADWAKEFFLPNPTYIPFAPGGNYILSKDRVHRYGVDYYEHMRSFLPYSQRPGEAQLVERSLYLLWK